MSLRFPCAIPQPRAWVLAALVALAPALAKADTVIVPLVEGEWWTIAATADQKITAVALWQAADGTWQLRATAHPQKLMGWESDTLDAEDWMPLSSVTPQSPRRPHVLRHGDTFAMASSDGHAVHTATSADGRAFEVVAAPAFAEGPFAHCSDPALIRLNDAWHLYYTVVAGSKSSLNLRRSPDLAVWSPPTIVAYGGLSGAGPDWISNPIVMEIQPGEFVCLTSETTPGVDNTRVYYSTNPYHFGIDDGGGLVTELPVASPAIVEMDGRFYIAAPTPERDGVRMARLSWARREVIGDAIHDFDDAATRAKWHMVSGDLDAVFFTDTHVPFYGRTEHYIGTCEQFEGGFDDGRTAVIECEPFTLDEPTYVLLIGGGRDIDTVYVALIDADTGDEIARYTGRDSNSVQPTTFVTGEHAGKRAFVRIVDSATGPWGHVNFGGIYRPGTPEVFK